MNRNFNGTQINQSVTITEKAGAEIKDVRNRIVKYDENGNVVLAAAGTDIPVGMYFLKARSQSKLPLLKQDITTLQGRNPARQPPETMSTFRSRTLDLSLQGQR